MVFDPSMRCSPGWVEVQYWKGKGRRGGEEGRGGGKGRRGGRGGKGEEERGGERRGGNRGVMCHDSIYKQKQSKWDIFQLMPSKGSPFLLWRELCSSSAASVVQLQTLCAGGTLVMNSGC